MSDGITEGFRSLRDTEPIGPEILKGKKCPSCGHQAVSKNGATIKIGYVEGIQPYCCHKCGCQWNSLQYPNYELPSLKERYEVVVEEYLTAFCQRNGFERKDGYWVGDRPGEIFDIADMFFDFREIRFDVDSNQPAKQIIDWHWKMVENALDKPFPDPFPNYENWCKMKPNTEEAK